MRRYRTEVVIPNDRVLVLHLPDDLPVGRASVVVQSEVPGSESQSGIEAESIEADRQDIEWWEEFDDEPAKEV